MRIIRNEQIKAMLQLALSEKDESSRYSYLNAIAETLKNSECIAERGFAAVCHELNNEVYAASTIRIPLSGLVFDDASLFANTCILLQNKNIEQAKECFQNAIAFFVKEGSYSELGMLIKIQKMLLKKLDIPQKDYFKGIDFPRITVIKSFTASLTETFTEDQLQLAEKIATEAVKNTVHVISCCTNMLEQKMLKVFLDHKIKVTCVPALPSTELFSIIGSDAAGRISAIYQDSEVHQPITEYTQRSSSGENVWNIIEDYSAKYLLGSAMLEREETGLPISFIWSDFSNVFPIVDIEKICNQHEITTMKAGL